MAEREAAVRDLDRTSATLRRVDTALDEIRDGTSGLCAGCGEEIPAKRLEVMAWSPYCAPCQERAEEESQRNEGPAADDFSYALAG